MYRESTALYEQQFEGEGFEWMIVNDYDNCVLAYLRKGKAAGDVMLVVLNMTPVPREQYPVGIPLGGVWEEVLNSDHPRYYGSGVINTGPLQAAKQFYNGREYTLSLRIPPLGVTILKPVTA
ncbi:alpha amylase C-terminal domain-containing protein [Chitinophaga oryzae]|uniref:alpha amylase C-terminal domain-containing protein n=1 Tax=Chitinophaga oryzae TaxID=2725414 RepID=UPI001FE398E3|nr:alpha amylase C-terminal domain-containing protein [Chitinophaga oryzae]